MPAFNPSDKLPNLPPNDFDCSSMLFLPVSPQMSHGTTKIPEEVKVDGGKGSVYDTLHSQQPISEAPQRLQNVFDMAASPVLSPRMLSPRMMLSRGQDTYMQGATMSPGTAMATLDGFLQGGLYSPASSFSSSSPPLGLSPGARVAKVPMRPARSHSSAKKASAPLLLPCQVVDLRTNRLGPQPGCPDVLVSQKAKPPDSPDSIFSSPEACTRAGQAPIFTELLSSCIDMGPWMADFAAHRSAYLGDFVKLDFENITVVEMKALLRKYGLARTGKKVELEDRIKQVALFLKEQIAKEQALIEGKKDAETGCDPSVYINT